MSTLQVNTIRSTTASTPPAVQDSNSVEIGTFCRAWVNFNGTGTVAIRNDFNVTSITDNGAGSYSLNFTTATSDANYSVVGTAKVADTSTGGSNVLCVCPYGRTTSESPTLVMRPADTPTDGAIISIAIFG